MYGIEYSAYASLIHNEDLSTSSENENSKFTPISQQTTPNFPSKNSINSSKLDFSYTLDSQLPASPAPLQASTDKLVQRLQTLNECPDYLVPRLSYKNSSQCVRKNDPTHYLDDFILLSEFSEIEGPKPLLTIPTDGGVDFNKNEYALHLMCVDFHSHSHHQNQYDSKSNYKFTFTQDTSIINYWDVSSTMVTACVHHFTLYDIEARGFVRPFCLSYISYDQKPLGFFEQIKDKFSKITDLFKKSNFYQFRIELENRSSDLKFTRDFFLKWSNDDLYEHKKDQSLRLKLALEQNLDNRTFSRLNSSCLNEASKNLQLNAIDNMIKEMEGILEVVCDELKRKNWLKDPSNHHIVHKGPRLTRNNSENIKTTSTIDNTFVSIGSRSNRSLTYPTSDYQEELTIRVDRTNLKKKQEHSHHHAHHVPKLYISILIGNSNSIGSELNFNINSDMDNLKIEKKKTMKRLHQLCADTARQAINELRLMHRHFSTSYYILKYKQLTQNTANYKSNLFWSITIGDCIISDFSTSIDTLNFNKQSLVRKSNSNSLIKSNENTLIQINNNGNINSSKNKSKEEKPEYSGESSIKTQFYSPIAEQTVYLDALATSTQSTTIKQIETVSNLNSNNNEKTCSWSNIEKFLDLDDENESAIKEDDETDDFYSNQEILYDESTSNDTTDLHTDSTSECGKEENEYDFANSLLTIEYRPYNQYSANLNTDCFYMSANSLALSLSSSSIGLYYKALNSLKFQSNLTDKLIQIQEFNYEETLKTLINSLPTIFPHLLYSLLKGRPVICISRYCSDLAYLQAVVDCLSNFIPNSFYCLNSLTMSKSLNNLNSNPKFTSSPNQPVQLMTNDRPQLRSIYERKPIRLNDLKYCKLFGLNLLISKDGCCSTECNDNLTNSNRSSYHKHKHYHINNKSQDDSDLLLIYIPITVRNYVSILDLDNLTFSGPKYNGTYLISCVNKCKTLQQDSIIYLYLLSNVFNFYAKTSFLYNYSILFEHDSNEIALKRASFSSLNNHVPNKSQEFDFSSKLTQNNKSEDYPAHNLNNRKTSYQFSTSTSSTITRKDRVLRYYSLVKNSCSHVIPNGDTKNRSDMDLNLLRMIMTPITPVNSSSNTSLTVSPSSTNQFINLDPTDLKIVTYLLKTLKIKQIYLYNLAMHKKELKQINKIKYQNDTKTSINKNIPLIQISTSTNDENSNKMKSLNGTSNTNNKSTTLDNNNTSNYLNTTLIKTDIQFPLLIEYEEITFFNNSKKG